MDLIRGGSEELIKCVAPKLQCIHTKTARSCSTMLLHGPPNMRYELPSWKYIFSLLFVWLLAESYTTLMNRFG